VKPTPEHRPDVPVLTFLGGTGTVTGSKYLVETPTARVLVDCGLYQGAKELRLRNWARFPVDPHTIDAMVLTHAHIDHSGAIPLLVKQGFTGPIFASANSGALAAIVLPDSGHLQEEEAAYANRRGFSKHRPALPLYTEQEARDSLGQFRSVPFGEPVEVADGVTITLAPAGHILGSSIVTMDLTVDGGRRLTFSGDLGRSQHPLLVPPAPIGATDVVLVESTYGNRTHDDSGTEQMFAEVISRTAARGGVVVIPAFAVDRTEVLLMHLQALRDRSEIPALPVYVDSPMALAALDVYRRAIAAHDPEIRPDLASVADLLGGDLVRPMRDVEDSMELDQLTAPAIIVSASGMATGGRVLHHLRRYLPDYRASIVLAGFQAEQTRGRQLVEGARQIKLLGQYVTVRAEIVDLPGLSVHADHDDLIDWLATAESAPDTTYVIHGEPEASAHLRDSIDQQLGWNAVVPRFGEKVRLDHRPGRVVDGRARRVVSVGGPPPRSGRRTDATRTLDQELLSGPDPAMESLVGDDPMRVARMQAELAMGFRALAGVNRAVSIFGSARTPVDSDEYVLARRTAAALGNRGFTIITGGGPGSMEAANHGARDADVLSIGLSIDLPEQQHVNPYVDLAIEFKHFYIRKIMFVRYASAFVVLPGGMGTLDELFEARSLIQTGKIEQFPVVLVGTEFWKGLLAWEREKLVGSGKVSAENLDLLHVVDDPDEVAAIVEASFAGRPAGVTAVPPRREPHRPRE
jgi:metallo-beta-lactamase family protein